MSKVTELRLRTSDGRIEALDFVRRITLGVTNRLMIEVDIDNDEDLVKKIVSYFKAWEYFLIRPTQLYHDKVELKKHQTSVNELQDAVQSLVNKKKAVMPFAVGSDLNFTESLIEAKDNGKWGITEENIRQCLLEMLLAGTDTSSVTVYYLLVSLAEHPIVQDKIYQEIINIIGIDDDVSKNDVPKLVCLEWALKESMRMKPVGPVIMRKALNDDVINGIPVSADTQIVINLARMHRKEEIFQDPEAFDPDAHFNQKTLNEKYVPFGTGPKGCIGQFLAMIEMKAILATFLREYEVISCGEGLKDIETRWDIAQQPTNPSYLYFKRRNDV